VRRGNAGDAVVDAKIGEREEGVAMMTVAAEGAVGVATASNCSALKRRPTLRRRFLSGYVSARKFGFRCPSQARFAGRGA
jgi:hypothetical protein